MNDREPSVDFPFDDTDPEQRKAYAKGLIDGRSQGVQLAQLAITVGRTNHDSLVIATATALLFNRSEKVTHAAKRIGVSRRTLYRHMRRIQAALRVTLSLRGESGKASHSAAS